MQKNGALEYSKNGKIGLIQILKTQIKITVNGAELKLEQVPIIQNGRTLVPMRAIFEAMEATVEWDSNTKTIIAKKDDVIITMKIGSYKVIVGEEQIEIDVAPQIINGRTLVPARAVAESLNAKVNWNADLETVIIEKE